MEISNIHSKYKRHISLALTIWILASAATYAQTTATTQDLEKIASKTFYLLPAEAIHQHGDSQEFLFLAPDLIRHDTIFGAETGKLVLGKRDINGKFSILWQYALPLGGMDAVWWSMEARSATTHFLVSLYGGQYLLFQRDGNQAPTLASSSAPLPLVESILLLPHTFFLSPPLAGMPDWLFYGIRGNLLALDLQHGHTATLWALDKPQSVATFLMVRDLDGDGSVDIVASTSRYDNSTRQRSPAVLRVWHYESGRYTQVYASSPQQHFAIAGMTLRVDKSSRPLIAAYEFHPQPSGGYNRYFHLYNWNGKTLQEVTSSEKVCSARLP